MKCFTIATLLLSSSCLLIKAVYLIEERDNGKEFWGKNYTVMEGDDLTIPCNSKPKSGGRGVVLYWEILPRQFGTKKYPKRTLIQKYPGRKAYGLTIFGIKAKLVRNTHKLSIKNITRYAAATYRCTVVTLTTKSYAERTYFNVRVKAPARIDSTMKTSLTLNEGMKLELDCTSTGDPTPKITWSRLGSQKLSPERVILHTKGLLSLRNVEQGDQGDYKCVASNSLGKDSKTFSVTVMVPARIINSEVSYGAKGEDGEIKCEAVGYPFPTFLWKWYTDKNERISLSEVDTRGRFSVETNHGLEKSVSYLKIKNVDASDFREYECRAKSGDISFKKFQFMPYSTPQRPTILSVAPKGDEISIKWTYGENGGKEIKNVVIEYTPMDSSQWERVTINDSDLEHYTIKNLRPQTQYRFRVFAVNEIGSSDPSAEHLGTTLLEERPEANKESIPDKNQDMKVMIGGVAGGFLVLIIAIVIVCISMRNIQRNNAKKERENMQRVSQNGDRDATTALLTYLQHGSERLSVSPGSGGTLPTSSEVLQLTTSNKWEFPRERLVLQNVLGSGAFGIVMKAEADGIKGFNSGTIPVAVKFVKENESPSAKKDLVAELELLKLIEPHTNVINLLGCCTRSDPLMVIVEYCAYGDLQSFLRSSRGIRDPYYIDCYKRPSSRLTSNELLLFGTQISRGMAHLASLKVIHRDLAARNILVDENKVCKVSDFGFARDIYVEDHYTRKTAGGRFPIKWMAIESLLDGISTTKSDVWSFAIVLWEIITLGASPYPGMNSQEVVSFLQNGLRMDKPKHCSDELYSLLLDCWQVATHRRPSFEMLARYLDKMCNTDFEYINMRTYDDHLYINFDGNTISGGSNSASLLKQNSASSSQHSQHSGDSLVHHSE